MHRKTVIKIPIAIGIGILLGAVVTINSPLREPVSAQDLPTPFIITPYFGKETISQVYWSRHRAIDFGSVDYERVLAAADGAVELVGWHDNNRRTYGYGLHMIIAHANGYETLYAHLSATAFNLTTTDADLPPQVKRGQVIATSGHTGNSTGPHLHFETRLNGTPVDPSNPSLWVDGWLDPNYYPAQNPNRPIPIPVDGTTITVDDLDPSPGFEKGCIASPNCPYWWEVNAGYNNHLWYTLVNGNVEDYWAKWTPNVPQQGIYEVYVYVHRRLNTTWQARYTISHADGISTGVIVLLPRIWSILG